MQATSTVLEGVVGWPHGLAPMAPLTTILRIETENNVRHVCHACGKLFAFNPDLVPSIRVNGEEAHFCRSCAEAANPTRVAEFTGLATVETSIGRVSPTLATSVAEANIVAVNGKPAKGIDLIRRVVIEVPPGPTTGQGSANLPAISIVDRILVLSQPDGNFVGSIMMLRLDGDPTSRGTAASESGNFAITGGTGAFLGMRGEFVSGSLAPPEVASPTHSGREDPHTTSAKKGRWPGINGGGKAIFLLHLIPMARPEVRIGPNGPSVYHRDFSPVTAERPARAGEILILTATNLGPTRPAVQPGKPFPVAPLYQVNSPVDVVMNGQSAEVIHKIGWPGLENVYRVDFRVPDGTAAGIVTLQLSAAWIAGAEVQIAVQ